MSEPRMLQMEVRLRLEGVGEEQKLRLAEKFAGQMERCRRAARESVGDADHRMAGAVGERLVAADEQIEIAERFIELLHHEHAEAVRLDELDGRNEAPGTNLIGTPALFGSLLHRAQQAGARFLVERRGRFRVTDEIDRLDWYVGQCKWHDRDAERTDDLKRSVVVTARLLVHDVVAGGAQVADTQLADVG